MKDVIEKFNNEITQILNSEPFNINKVPDTGLFYHYRSGLSILGNRELWFSDYRYLNDPTEALFFDNFVHQTLNGHIKKNNNGFWAWFSKQYPKLLQRYSIHICSFSEMEDYLPMWRWYGGNGAGYCFGFKINVFEKKEEANNVKIVHVKTLYDQNKLFDLLEKIFGITDKYLVNDTKLYGEIAHVLASHLLSLTPAFKHEGYQHEREFRTYISEFASTDGKKYPLKIPDSVRGKNPKGSPILKIPFSEDDLSEIWVGPCLNFQTEHKKIKEILKSSSYDTKKIEIKASQMPYKI